MIGMALQAHGVPGGCQPTLEQNMIPLAPWKSPVTSKTIAAYASAHIDAKLIYNDLPHALEATRGRLTRIPAKARLYIADEVDFLLDF